MITVSWALQKAVHMVYLVGSSFKPPRSLDNYHYLRFTDEKVAA